MIGILAELLRNGQESGRTTRIRFERRERITAGEKERRRMRCQLPAPFEQEARDDILGGIPTMAIAGLLLTSSFQEEAITPSQMPSVQNCTWAKQRPERQGDDPGGSAEKSNAEVQRNNRQEKKSAPAIAFERERGYKKKAQRKRGRR
jgi:hypothetical protein